MKDIHYVMYLWNEIEVRRKEKEDRKKMMQNQKPDVDNEEKKEKDQHDTIEKMILDKEKQKVINELEVAKPGETTYNFDDNTEIGLSSGLKSVHESPNEPSKEDTGTSSQQNDAMQSPSQAKQQKLAKEHFGTSDQQNDVPQAKRQKME